MKYKIVYRGKYNIEISKDAIAKNLSDLFDLPCEYIKNNYIDQEYLVLIDGLDSEDADVYAKGILSTGLIIHKEFDLIDDFGEPLSEEQNKNLNNDYSYADTLSANTETYYASMYDQISHKQNNEVEISLHDAPSEIVQNRIDTDQLEKRQNTLTTLDVFHGQQHLLGRTNRLDFIIKILAVFFGLIFVNNILSVFLVSLNTTIAAAADHEMAVYTCSFLTLLLFTLLLVFIIQRLHDLDRSALYLFIIIFPLIITVYGYAANYFNPPTIVEPFETTRSLFNNASPAIELRNVESVQKSSDDLNLQAIYIYFKPLFVLSISISLIILMTLTVLPGSKTNNSYGAPIISQLATRHFFSIGIFIVLLFSIILIPLYMQDYGERKAVYDQTFFSIIRGFGIK